MDIPIISTFMNGLRLFLEDKRLKWLFVVFIVGVLYMTLIGNLALLVVSVTPSLAPAVMVFYAVTGGVLIVFFMITTLLILVGLKRIVASDQSYARSFLFTVIWLGLSFPILILLVAFAMPLFLFLVFVVAFVGWISFQSYFATRNSLRYAGIVTTSTASRGTRVLSVMSHFLCYIVIVAALIISLPLSGSIAVAALTLLGSIIVLLFNFINGVIMKRNSDRPVILNIALLGLFVSLYSAYFIYSASTARALPFDPIGMLISIFFIIYTMSAVGSTLASRSKEETRWKISAELAAAITFFLASGYYFADLLFEVTGYSNAIGSAVSELFKLLIFPLVAMVGQFVYIRRINRPPPTAPVTEPVAPSPVSEPSTSDEMSQELPETQELPEDTGVTTHDEDESIDPSNTPTD